MSDPHLIIVLAILSVAALGAAAMLQIRLNRARKFSEELEKTAALNSREMNRLYRLLKRHDKTHKDMLQQLEKSRSNYESIFNTTSQGLLIVSGEAGHSVLHSNWRFHLLSGLLDQDINGKPVDSLFQGQENQKHLSDLIAVSLRGEKISLDWLLVPVDSDREPTWVSLNMLKVTYDSVEAILISFVDISTRKHAELNIRTDNIYLNALLRIHQLLHRDSSLSTMNLEVFEIIAETSAATEVIYLEKDVGGAFREEINYHREYGAMLHRGDTGDPVMELSTHFRDQLTAGHELILDAGEAEPFLSLRREMDVPENLIIVPVLYQHSLIGILLLVFQYRLKDWFSYESDFLASCASAISVFREHQNMLAALNERELQFRTLSNSQQAAIFIVQGRRIIFANARFFEFTGLEINAPVHVLFSFVPDHARPVLASFIHELSNRESKSLRTDLEVVIPSRPYSWIDLLASRIQFSDKAAWLFSVYDISEKKRVEKRLSLAQFSIDTAASSILWFNEQGRIIYANEKALMLLDYDAYEMSGRHIYEIDEYLSSKPWKEFWESFTEKRSQMFETRHISRTGSLIPMECSLDILITPENSYGFIYSRDIRKRLEDEKLKNELKEQLNRSERLESLGFMAAGVAHEINNPMMGILNYIQIIHDKISDTLLKEYADIIIREGKRISMIVSRLLDFSNPHNEVAMPVLIDTIIQDSLLLVGSNLKKSHITIKDEISGKGYFIHCKKGAIQQVLLNLLQNARYSLDAKYPDEDPRKVIELSGSITDQDKTQELAIKIRDTGMGIPKKHLPHIFTPYFTTKVRKEGTGLGLALSHRIIEEHGGRITVRSKEKEYAEFTLHLPVNGPSPEAAMKDPD